MAFRRLVWGAGLAVPLLCSGVAPAFSYCSEPSFSENAPEAPRSYQRPDVPDCLSDYKYSGRHTCDEYEIDSFIRETNDYIRLLNDYASEAEEFANEASTFARDAADYARCERNELVEEVQ